MDSGGGGFAETDAPPPPRRTHASLMTLAALFSAVALVLAVAYLRPHDAGPGQEPTPSPGQSPVDLPAASAVEPGAGIYVQYADGSGGMGCTAGFLVHTTTGQPAILTAGHCNRPGQPSAVTVNLAGVLPYATVGRFTQEVSEGDRIEQHDIGLIVLDGDNVPQTPAIGGSMPVSGVDTKLMIGEQLCKFGMGSGEAACGPVVDVTDSKVVFLAKSKCGDSGGPVYEADDNGTARAVGILIRGGDVNKANPGCSTPTKFSVAELIQPWLDKWGLVAVTGATVSR